MSYFFAQVRDGQPVEPVLAMMEDITEKSSAKPISDAEVERARTQLLSQIDLSLNASDRVGLALSDWIGLGDWRLLFLNRDRLRAVKTADVQRVWANYFKPSNRTAAPDRVTLPAAPDVAAMVKDYKGDAAKAEGEAFDPSIANIEARTTRKQLPGGFDLVMLPKKTRGGTVFSGIALRFGDVKSLNNVGDVPIMTASMLMRGTTKHTRQQIEDEFDRLKARVNLNSWGSGLYVSIETTRENYPAVLDLVAEIFRSPSFDPKELEQLRSERLASLEQQRSDPSQLAFTAFSKVLNPYPQGDIRYVDSVDESAASIKAVTREQIQRFYKDFYGAQPAQMSAVGDFDPAALEAQMTKLLVGWKAAKPFTRVPDPYFDVAGQSQKIETPDKAQAFFVLGTNLDIRDDDPDYPALVLGNYMFGGGFLNSRLMTRIRVKDGLSYGGGSQFQADSFDKSGQFLAYAIYAPQNLAKLEQAINEEVARVLKDGFTAEEVAAAKSGWMQGRSVSRSQDNEVSRTLGHYLFLGRTLAWDADLEKKVAALDGEQIRAAMARHIDPKKFVVVRAGDFAGAAAKK
jgi:zinc protease